MVINAMHLNYFLISQSNIYHVDDSFDSYISSLMGIRCPLNVEGDSVLPLLSQLCHLHHFKIRKTP